MTEVTCSFCYDEVESSQVVRDFCDNSDEHGIVCQSCMTYYIGDKIKSSFLGSCPSMYCPCVHNKGQRKLLKFPNWRHVVGTSLYSRYEKLAESLVAFLCGSCHALKTLLIRYDPTGSDALANDMSSESFQLLDASLSRYVSGDKGIEELYSQVLPEVFPGFVSVLTDREAFDCMTTVLKCIANPERRANLQLRHYRSRPRIWTHCCSKEHCYRCQTRDFHDGRSCEEHRASLGAHLYDSSTVSCPSCGVCLAKGDGCNTVVCVCGKQFQWQAEKILADNCRRFAEAHPEDTSWAAVQVLCRTLQEQPGNANAWRQRHMVETNQGFIRWWQEKYPHCPSQSSILTQNSQSHTQQQMQPPPSRYIGYALYGGNNPIDGIREARELWRSTHTAEVVQCEQQRGKAIDALFLALAPPGQRASTAVRILSNMYGQHEPTQQSQSQGADLSQGQGAAHAQTAQAQTAQAQTQAQTTQAQAPLANISSSSNCYSHRIWLSAQRWVNNHYQLYKQARFEHDCRSALQFLYLYGKRPLTHTITTRMESGHVLSSGKMRRCGMYYTSVAQWDRRCSNEYLTYAADDTVVSRNGGISCYPAAIAPLPSNQAMITLRVDTCPRSCNILSFGLSYRPPEFIPRQDASSPPGPVGMHASDPKQGSKQDVSTSTPPPPPMRYPPSTTINNNRDLFPKHNSHGVGRIANSWGLVDERQTSYVSASHHSPSSSTHALIYASAERVGHFRKLKQGDIFQGVVNTDEGWFDLHLDGDGDDGNDMDNSRSSSSSSSSSDLESGISGSTGSVLRSDSSDPADHRRHSHHRFEIPKGQAEDFAFAVTMANDHRLSIVESSVAVSHHHDRPPTVSISTDSVPVANLLAASASASASAASIAQRGVSTVNTTSINPSISSITSATESISNNSSNTNNSSSTSCTVNSSNSSGSTPTTVQAAPEHIPASAELATTEQETSPPIKELPASLCYVDPNAGHLVMMGCFRKLLVVLESAPLKLPGICSLHENTDINTNTYGNNTTTSTSSDSSEHSPSESSRGYDSDTESEEGDEGVGKDGESVGIGVGTGTGKRKRGTHISLAIGSPPGASSVTTSHRRARQALATIAASPAFNCPDYVNDTQQILRIVEPYAAYWQTLCAAHASELYSTPTPPPTPSVAGPGNRDDDDKEEMEEMDLSDLTPSIESTGATGSSDIRSNNSGDHAVPGCHSRRHTTAQSQYTCYAHCNESHENPDADPENTDSVTPIPPLLHINRYRERDPISSSSGQALKTDEDEDEDVADADRTEMLEESLTSTAVSVGKEHMLDIDDLTQRAMQLLAAFQARESLDQLLRPDRLNSAVREIFTWENLLAAVCYDRQQRKQSKKEKGVEMATAFLAQHGADAVFMAAAVCAGVASHSHDTGEYQHSGGSNNNKSSNNSGAHASSAAIDTSSCTALELAQAFMATYPFEMHEWYDDNASSADPLLVDPVLGKASIIPECRCLPRHFKISQQTQQQSSATYNSRHSVMNPAGITMVGSCRSNEASLPTLCPMAAAAAVTKAHTHDI